MPRFDTGAFAPAHRYVGEPTFDEPWQAQVLALAFSLAERGLFSGEDWSRALGAMLAKAQERGAPDTAGTYYLAALAALESLLVGDGRISEQELGGRIAQWRRAYLMTPHGKPVLLERGNA